MKSKLSRIKFTSVSVFTFLFYFTMISSTFSQTIARVEVSPKNPTLIIGESIVFTAKAYDAQGNEVPLTNPHWESNGTNGTIATDPADPTKCTYTATSAGSDYVSCYAGEPQNDPPHGSTDITIESESPQCCLTTSVIPVITAGTVSPNHASGNCGTQVDLKAQAEDGWAFIRWQGAASGSATTATVTLHGNAPDNCEQAIALFGPILKLDAGPDNPGYQAACPPEDENEETNTAIAQIMLTASEADDWNVSSITFSTEGTGNEKTGVKLAKLHSGDKDGSVISQSIFSADNGRVIFAVDLTVHASTSVLLTLTYDFAVYEKGQENPYVGKFYAYTNMALIEAVPATYQPGVETPSDDPSTKRVIGGPTAVGCVHNINMYTAYDSIQTAIDDARLDGQTLKVCPGTFNENIDVSKSLTIKSIQGAEKTIVQGSASNNHVFQVKKSDAVIDGFTIKGATGENKAGICIYNNAPFPMKDKILNNKIFGNYYGLFLNYSWQTEIKGNTISENKIGRASCRERE